MRPQSQVAHVANPTQISKPSQATRIPDPTCSDFLQLATQKGCNMWKEYLKSKILDRLDTQLLRRIEVSSLSGFASVTCARYATRRQANSLALARVSKDCHEARIV